MTDELRGKVALVTGAGSGIGEAIAGAFAHAGANTIMVDIDRPALERAASTMGVRREQLRTIVADCGDVAEVRRIVDETVEAFDRIDILINNAGVTFQVDMLELDETGWDRVNRVNIKGVFFALQRAAAQMIRQGEGGRIINIASISGRGYPNPANVAYAASKAAVISLTQVAARRLGPDSINVNAICPGMTMTPLMQSVLDRRAQALGVEPETVRAEIERTIPIRRVNTPDDIAAMALFLAGPGGRNITGQSYNVDGGLVTN